MVVRKAILVGWMSRCWALFLCAVLAGCSSKGNVSGQVSYKGKPLPMGTVVFVPEKGHTITGVIQEGRYEVKGIAVGNAKIGVQTPASSMGNVPQAPSRIPKGMGPPKDVLPPGADPSMFDPRAQREKLRKSTVRIPDNYQNPEQSGLKYEVKGGNQEYNIELK